MYHTPAVALSQMMTPTLAALPLPPHSSRAGIVAAPRVLRGIPTQEQNEEHQPILRYNHLDGTMDRNSSIATTILHHAPINFTDIAHAINVGYAFMIFMQDVPSEA